MCKGICVFLFFCSAGLFSCKYVVLLRKILQNLLVFSNDCLHNDYANTLYTWNYNASDVKLLCIYLRQIKYWQYDPWNMIKFDRLALYVKHLPHKMSAEEI
jgi:hypothetical protein